MLTLRLLESGDINFGKSVRYSHADGPEDKVPSRGPSDRLDSGIQRLSTRQRIDEFETRLAAVTAVVEKRVAGKVYGPKERDPKQQLSQVIELFRDGFRGHGREFHYAVLRATELELGCRVPEAKPLVEIALRESYNWEMLVLLREPKHDPYDQYIEVHVGFAGAIESAEMMIGREMPEGRECLELALINAYTHEMDGVESLHWAAASDRFERAVAYAKKMVGIGMIGKGSLERLQVALLKQYNAAMNDNTDHATRSAINIARELGSYGADDEERLLTAALRKNLEYMMVQLSEAHGDDSLGRVSSVLTDAYNAALELKDDRTVRALSQMASNMKLAWALYQKPALKL